MNDRHDDESDAVDRQAILSRRQRFVASALASIALSSCASGVNPHADAAADVRDAPDGSDAQPQVCLSRPIDVIDWQDAAPEACLSAPDAQPMPCLDPVIDSGNG